MRVLIVEDDNDIAAALGEELSGAEPSIDTVIVRSRASGIEALRSDEFDVIICDLRLPPQDGGVDIAEAHGLAVHSEARTVCPGTPCLFFTGYATSPDILEQLSSGGTQDILGTGESYGMTRLLTKDKFLDCVERLESLNAELSKLDTINIDVSDSKSSLDHIEGRALRLLARQLQGTNIEANSLGGQSGAQALRTSVKNNQGHTVASLFAKVGSRNKMQEERKNYHLFVSPLLGMGNYPALVREIEAGIGKREALFYQLANEYTKSLFDILKVSESSAVAFVEALRDILAPWNEHSEKRVFRIRDLRTQRIDDSAFLPYRDALGSTEAFEEIEREMSTSCQHGDLHGSNALCNESGKVIIIDFGNVGPAPSCIDPIILELSILFHSDSPFGSNSWPTNQQAKAWFNLEEYLQGCPAPAFIKKCREWANEAGEPADVSSVVYAEAVRQLKYGDTNHDRALGIAYAAMHKV